MMRRASRQHARVADAQHLRLLCPRREQPRRRRAAEQRDELAPFQLIGLHPFPASRNAVHRMLTNLRQKVLHQSIEDFSPLEIDRVPTVGYLLNFRVRHERGKRIR
jgi:hypothetical protein